MKESILYLMVVIRLNFVDKNTLKTPCESRFLGDGLTNLFVMNITKYDTKANKNIKWTKVVSTK